MRIYIIGESGVSTLAGLRGEALGWEVYGWGIGENEVGEVYPNLPQADPSQPDRRERIKRAVSLTLRDCSSILLLYESNDLWKEYIERENRETYQRPYVQSITHGCFIHGDRLSLSNTCYERVRNLFLPLENP